MHSLVLKPLIFSLVWLTCVIAHGAEDPVLRDLMTTLATAEDEDHATILDEMVQTGDIRLLPFFNAYREGSVYAWSNQAVVVNDITRNDDLDEFAALLDPLTQEALTDDAGQPLIVPIERVTEVETGRKERKMARSAAFLLGLRSPDQTTRLAAVRRCGAPPRDPSSISVLEEIRDQDPVKGIRYSASESLGLIALAGGGADEPRIAAATELGRLRSARGGALITDMMKSPNDLSVPLQTEMRAAQEKIDGYQGWVKKFDGLKFGLSTGSIYILMALGLAIIYGLMGVINMAHGELMMIGAYTTFVVQQIFGHGPGTPANEFFLVALPASFIVAALVGALIEWLVVRHLYHRPLESLLATVGVSFILIQIVRLIFGDNQTSNSPTWLVGSFDVLQDMSLSYNRVFIFILTILTLVAVLLLLRRTTLGLQMRATMQNRDMANALGVNARRIYMATFMLGSGIAGLAGCALTTVSGITPDMGQNYIVESFLIVVVGGVGNIMGVVVSGLGLGTLLQFFENTLFGPVWAKILILVFVVIFIQFRPSGIFPPKGRLADD